MMLPTRHCPPCSLVTTNAAPAAGLAVEVADGGSADLAWDLLDSSGYLEETTPALRATLRPAYREYWRRVHPGGDDYLLLAHSAGQPIGTVAASRLGGGTWIWHQFGIDAAFRRTAGAGKARAVHALYRSLAVALHQDPRVERMVITCARHKPFNVATYHGFAAALGDRDACSVHDLTVHKIDPCQAIPPAPAAPAARLRADEWQHLAAWHATQAPRAASLGLELAAPHAAAGERLGFGLRRGEQLVAAAVVDLAGLGSNLFGLRNTMRVFDLGLADGERIDASRELAAHAIAAFGSRGEREALWLTEPGTLPPPPEAGFQSGIAAMHFAIAHEALPAWIDHLDAMCARRLQVSA